jgi:reactive intermediate/imine deaminase
MPKHIVQTDKAPSAIGAYSQAVTIDAGKTTYLSGQVPLDPETMEIVSDDFLQQAEQTFHNLAAVALAAGGSLNDCVKLNIYLTDLGQFQAVNDVMAEFVKEPYPARAAVEVSALPKGAQIETDGVMVTSTKQ